MCRFILFGLSCAFAGSHGYVGAKNISTADLLPAVAGAGEEPLVEPATHPAPDSTESKNRRFLGKKHHEKVSEDEVIKQRAALLEACGEVCDVNKKGVSGKYFDSIPKSVDCTRIFDEPTRFLKFNQPPERSQIPESFLAHYTMENQVPLVDYYLNRKKDMKSNGVSATWEAAMIDEEVKHVSTGLYEKIKTSYGPEVTKQIHRFFQDHRDAIQGKHCAVIGSQIPWAEALLLEVGVARITTVEYATLHSRHDKISTMFPHELPRMAAGDKENHFDCVVSFSSLEHSGLGRYGDPLDPWGDLRTMARLQCVTKPNAAFFIGFPYGDEAICWNAHRIYGPKRSAHMFANIKITESSMPEYVDKANHNQGTISHRKICRGEEQPMFFGRKYV